MGEDFGPIMAFTAGAFAATLLIAFLASRLGLYLRRSSRYEPATVVGVHIICFFILGAVACSAKASSPGSSGLTVLVAQVVVLVADLLRLPRPEDYRDDVPQTTRALTGARLAAVAASVLLGFGLVYALARPASDREIVAELEQGVKEVPGGAVYLEALKRDFPQEYQDLAIDTARRLRGARSQGGGTASEVQLGAFLGRQIRAMVASKAAAMAKAPTLALNAYSRSMKDYVLTLQRTSSVACAALVSGPVGDEAAVRVPPAADEATARMLAARLDLARVGLDHPAQRQVAPPPRAALRQFADDIRRRDASLAPFVGDPRMATILSARDRCAIAVHYYSAIAEMPAETSAILAAYDIASAANPGSASATAPPPEG
jgi:hypothetical protein